MAEIAVIIGTGALGMACARRIGAGKHLLLGDWNLDELAGNAAKLSDEGYRVDFRQIDITDENSVMSFAAAAAAMGRIKTIVHTAGLSPHMSAPEKILAVNLLGTVHVLDAFLPLALDGTAAVVIASNAGFLEPMPADAERRLALEPAGQLMATAKTIKGWDTGLGAYWLSKRANQLRVEAMAPAWGKIGARIVSVSPGIISTQMTRFEREQGSLINEAVASTPMRRIGSPADIAEAVAWLTGPNATFVTGIDLRVDGGMIAALRWTEYETDSPTAR